MARAITVMALFAIGCGAPQPLPCLDDGVCGGGSCVEGFCADYDSACTSGLRYHESAGELAGECTLGGGPGGDGKGDGNGSADDIYVLGESNTVNAANARDDITPSCAAPGGKDVMFDIAVQAPGRLYVDTYGTTYGVVLAVYDGTCAALTPASLERSCAYATCGPTTQQWSEILAAGAYCVVVDQLSAQEPAGALVVRSKLGLPSPLGNDAADANRQNIGTTCGPDLVQASCNAQSAGDASWFFMTCGQETFWVDTCDDYEFRGFVTAFGLSRTALACTPGCSGPAMQLVMSTPSPFWVVADDIASVACGSVQVYVSTGVVQ
jgi:hypothetical protein